MSDTIRVTRGNTLSLPFEFVDSAGDEFNLSGSTLIFYALTLSGKMTKSTADGSSGFAITDATNGAATLTLTPAETRTLRPLTGSTWEIERRYTGTEETIASGVFLVDQGLNEDA